MLSHFSCAQLFVTLWTTAHQAPWSMEFSKQEYWSGLPWPPPGDLPYPGFQPASLMSPALAGRFFTTSATWEAQGPQSTADVTILSLNLNLPTQSLQLWGPQLVAPHGMYGGPFFLKFKKQKFQQQLPPSTAWVHSLSGGGEGALTFDIHHLFLRQGSPNCRSFTKPRSVP